eukprot:8748508-Pyramimonas_sp.AAC.1
MARSKLDLRKTSVLLTPKQPSKVSTAWGCNPSWMARSNSLPRLCLEGFLLSWLKGPGSGNRPGWFPQYPPRGSPSYVPLAD